MFDYKFVFEGMRRKLEEVDGLTEEEIQMIDNYAMANYGITLGSSNVITAEDMPRHSYTQCYVTGATVTAQDLNSYAQTSIDKTCPYCGNTSGKKDNRGGCISCGAVNV